LAPWAVRNFQVFGEPVPVVDSAYLHLWVGNNPYATGGPATPEAWGSAPTEELRQASRQPERYARLGPAVREEVTSRPYKTLERRGRAALYFFFGEGWFHGTLAERTEAGAEGVPGWLGRAYPVLLQGSLLGLLLLALLGWRWSYGWQFESMPAELAMIW